MIKSDRWISHATCCTAVNLWSVVEELAAATSGEVGVAAATRTVYLGLACCPAAAAPAAAVPAAAFAVSAAVAAAQAVYLLSHVVHQDVQPISFFFFTLL